MKMMKVRLRRSFAIGAAGVLLAGICIGQSAPVGHAAVPQSRMPDDSAGAQAVQEFQQRAPRYQLRAGDVFDLRFEFTPEFNQTETVQPDGYITLRGAGDLYVAGLTVPELTERIRSAYGKILKDPAFAVVPNNFDKPYFIAAGQVQRPGKYELRGDTTLFEAISMAGGFNASAKHSQVVLFRRISRDWMEGRVLDVKKMMNDKSLREDIHLKPGDMVFVPQSTISKILRYVPVPSMGISVAPPIP